MPDQEFERYLAILSGLLRLDPARRDEIVAELRDHLEARLDELLAEGFSRHKAIVIALEEFGDAAGLAGEFLQIFRRQRRRWVMRLTAGSVAACVVVALVAMALWPDKTPVPGLPRVVAQEEKGKPVAADDDPFGKPPEKTKTDTGQPPARVRRDRNQSATIEERNAVTESLLAERKEAAYPETVLKDVLQNIAARFQVEIFVNHKRIKESGKDLNDPSWSVDLDLRNVRGDMLLDLVLRDAGLVYTIRDGIVVVTTPDDLESTLEVRVYNCRDLVALMHEFPAGAMGAPGMMGGMGPGLGGFGGAGGGRFGDAAPATGGIGDVGDYGAEGAAGADAGIAAPGGFPGADSGGGEAGDQPGVPRGLGRTGRTRRSGAMSGTGSMPGMPGMGGMSGMPGDMPGMSMPGGVMPGVMPGGMGGGVLGDSQKSTNVPDLDALIAVITSTVAPESWQDVGGAGTLQAYYGGLLIVNNNPQVHRKIEKLLTMMRDAAQQPPGAVVREK